MSLPKSSPRSLLKHSTLFAAGLAVAASVAFAGGHGAGPHEAAIKARQGMMQLFAFNLGILGAMAKGDMEYDSEKAGAAAANVAALSGLHMGAAWPQGSDNASVDGTRALPAIWQNFPDVGAKLKALNEAAVTMADAAGTDVDALRATIGGVGQVCGACHKAYRAEE